MLKQVNDGISKVWKVHRSSDPFYDGGKVEVSKDETRIFCVYENNVSIVDLTDGRQNPPTSNLNGTLVSNDESESNPIVCFCSHPTKNEIVVATQKSVLCHWIIDSSSVTGGDATTDIPSSQSAVAQDAQGGNGINTRLVRTIRAGQMPILCMEYDATGTLVATGSTDRIVRVWDISGGYCTHSLRGHTDIIRSVTFHPDPHRLQLISTADDASVRLFDLVDSKCCAILQEHVSLPTALAISPADGYLMATCGRDKVVNFYELRRYHHLRTVPLMEELESLLFLHPAHAAQLLHLPISPSSVSSTNSATSDKKLKKQQKQALAREVDKSSTTTNSAPTIPHVLIVAGESGVLKFFQIDTNSLVMNSNSEGLGESCKVTPLLHFALSPARRLRISSSSSSGGVGGVGGGISSSTSPQQQQLQLMGIVSLRYLPKSHQVLAVTKDYNFYHYDISAFERHLAQQQRSIEEREDLNPSKLLIGSQGEILDLALIPKPILQQVSDSDPASTTTTTTTSSSSSSSSEFSSGFQIAVVTNSTQVRIMNQHFHCQQLLEGHKDIVLSVSVSPDGRWLITSSKDHRCLLWLVGSERAEQQQQQQNLPLLPSAATGTSSSSSSSSSVAVAACEGHTDAVGAVVMSRNLGTYSARAVFAISGGADKILKRWRLPVHTYVNDYASPHSDATGIRSRSRSSKDMNTDTVLTSSHSVRAHDKDINSVALSPNDAIAASASQDKTVRLWKTTDLTPIATLKGHKRGVWKVQFSPVDKVLASCAGDRTVKLWSVVDYTVLRTFEGHTASVLTVTFVNHGAQLLSAGADGLVRCWTVRTGECECTLDVHTDRVWALACITATAAQASLQGSDSVGGGVGGGGRIEVAAATGEGTRSGSGQDEASMSTANTTGGAVATTVNANAEAGAESLYFFSGGSDSRLLLWRDGTKEEAVLHMEQAEQNLLLEQQLQNDIRNGRYDKALTAALDLGHSLKVLNIIMTILEEQRLTDAGGTGGGAEEADEGDSKFSNDWSRRLDPYVQRLTDTQIDKIVAYVKDWNTNARHCYPAQIVINSLFRVLRVSKLCKHRVMLESLSALVSYSERHYQRLDRLNQASYMLQYFASKISLMQLRPEDQLDGINGSRRHNQNQNQNSLLLTQPRRQSRILAAPATTTATTTAITKTATVPTRTTLPMSSSSSFSSSSSSAILPASPSTSSSGAGFEDDQGGSQDNDVPVIFAPESSKRHRTASIGEESSSDDDEDKQTPQELTANIENGADSEDYITERMELGNDGVEMTKNKRNQIMPTIKNAGSIKPHKSPSKSADKLTISKTHKGTPQDEDTTTLRTSTVAAMVGKESKKKKKRRVSSSSSQ